MFLITNALHQMKALHYMYLQKHGTAMGKRMAPSCVNILLGKLEGSLLQQVTRKPVIWWRYTDHVFSVRLYSEDNFQTFFNEINSFHPTIRFSAKWS